jgi:hypothetical protein
MVQHVIGGLKANGAQIQRGVLLNTLNLTSVLVQASAA